MDGWEIVLFVVVDYFCVQSKVTGIPGPEKTSLGRFEGPNEAPEMWEWLSWDLEDDGPVSYGRGGLGVRVGREIEGKADGREGGPRELSLLSELQVLSILARAGESTNDLALVIILKTREPHIKQWAWVHSLWTPTAVHHWGFLCHQFLIKENNSRESFRLFWPVFTSYYPFWKWGSNWPGVWLKTEVCWM